MKLRRIDFDDEDERPAEVTVTMSRKEALFLAALLGPLPTDQPDRVMRDGSEICMEIFTCLSEGVFDPYWPGGVEAALRERQKRLE